jgi:hypothetical protein
VGSSQDNSLTLAVRTQHERRQDGRRQAHVDCNGDTISDGASAGSLLFVGAGPILAQDNANLFWDNTNNVLKSANAASTGGVCTINDCIFIGGALQTGASLWLSSTFNRASDCYFSDSGNVKSTASANSFDNITVFKCRTSETHCIKLAAANRLTGAIAHGDGTTTAKGILASELVSGCFVSRLNNAAGIESQFLNDVIVGNRVYDLNGGTAYIYKNGNVASGNFGYPRAASDSNNDDVIELHAESGALTTKSLTTVAGSS